MAERSVLAFGDSLTWGFLPSEPMFPTRRHQIADRWPSVMAASLGSSCRVIDEGLNARTTDIDDPLNPHRNGAAYLPPCLLSHQPLDLVVIMLGSNDTKDHLGRTVGNIANGMAKLVEIVQTTGDERLEGCTPCPVLIVSPPPFGPRFAPEIAGNFQGAPAKRAALAELYAEVARTTGAHFLDAATFVPTQLVGPDGLHLTAAANRALGQAVAAHALEIFA